ncbi:MAG: hypothetical protein FIB08_15470 [Candidatus Methanoperedens sp.]|nr:hypothetical protein [Candidatus Methanoperedens sp.]
MVGKSIFNTNKWYRYSFASFIAWIFMSFIVGWLFLIPIVVAGLLVYGYIVYIKERKDRITVAIKPTEAMKALARREAELEREKKRILFEEFGR